MGRIQSSVGLISGMDLVGTVDKLIALDSVPLNNLKNRVTRYQEQQAAFADLSALFMKANYMISNLGKVSVHERLDVKSSNESVLKVARKGNPVAGTHTFTPVKLATSHQILATGVSSPTAALGKKADVTLRFGRNLETNFNLKDLNGGDGVARGQIRITDQSGAKATIDLRAATTMKDVLDAINNNENVSVLAELDGDRLKLTDLSGGTSNNLLIQEVGTGTTAASLGLIGSGVANDGTILTGADIVKLGNNLSLNALNDGNGLPLDSLFGDLMITMGAKQTTIDFAQVVAVNESGTSDGNRKREATVGDLLNTINTTLKESGMDNLKAEISDDGKSVNWKTTDGTDFQIFSATLNKNPILHALGIDEYNEAGGMGVASSGGEINGKRIIGNLNSVLLASLNGGRGITLAAGDINLKDADGNTATITFTAADVEGIDTLDQYIALMNQKLKDDAPNVKFTVKMNSSKSGLDLVDFSNGSATTVQFEDANGGNMAEAMGLTRKIDVAAKSYSSKNLNLQVVSLNTKLADLNGGKGIDLQGALRFIDSTGRQTTVELNQNMVTVDDLVTAMSSVSIALKINEAGDGFMLVDLAGGTGRMSVAEGSAYSTAAKDLHFLGVTSEMDQTAYIGSANTYQTMNCSLTTTLSFDETATLNDIRDAINKAGAGFSASILNDGSSYRLSIGSSQTGYASNMVVDLSQFGLGQDTLTEPQDAVLVYGSLTGNSIMITSKSNTFIEPVPGINLTINATSTTPITVSTEPSSLDVKVSLKTFVENYNEFREKYNEYNYANPYSGTYGLLFGDSMMLRLDNAINQILTGRIFGVGKIQSLRELGITLSHESGEVVSSDDEEQKKITSEIGKLTFDEDKFDALFASDPEAIKDFFTKTITVYDEKEKKEVEKSIGFATKYTTMADSFTNTVDGSLGTRYASLQTKVDDGNDRMIYLQKLLDSKRTRLLNSFIRMENSLAKLQDASNAVSKIGQSSSTS